MKKWAKRWKAAIPSCPHCEASEGVAHNGGYEDKWGEAWSFRCKNCKKTWVRRKEQPALWERELFTAVRPEDGEVLTFRLFLSNKQFVLGVLLLLLGVSQRAAAKLVQVDPRTAKKIEEWLHVKLLEEEFPSLLKKTLLEELHKEGISLWNSKSGEFLERIASVHAARDGSPPFPTPAELKTQGELDALLAQLKLDKSRRISPKGYSV